MVLINYPRLFNTGNLKLIKKQAIVEKNNKQSWEYKSGYEYTEEFLYLKQSYIDVSKV